MTCPDCAKTGYVMQDIGTATVPDYVEVRCRCNPAPTDEDWFRNANRLECMNDDWTQSDPDVAARCEIEPDRCTCRAYCREMDAHEDYLRTHPWHDTRAGYPGETPDCPFDPTPADQPNYLYGTE